MSSIHDRMPIILDSNNAEQWLFDSKFAKEYVHEVMPEIEHTIIQ